MAGLTLIAQRDGSGEMSVVARFWPERHVHQLDHLTYSDTVAVIGVASNCEVHSPSLTWVVVAIEHGGKFSVTKTVTL
jgi:hypothetical protein